MQVVERVNIRAAKYYYTLSLEQFRELLPRLSSTKKKGDQSIESKHKRVIQYCREMIANNGEITREYTGKYRIYSHKSIQTLPREIRNGLLNGLATDIDIVNSGFVVISWLVRYTSHGQVRTPVIDDYIANRQTVLRNVGDIKDTDSAQVSACKRDKAKQQILSLLFEERRRTSSNSWLNALNNEIRAVIEHVKKIDGFKDMMPVDKEDNKGGSFLSRVYQALEDQILHKMMTYLIEKDYQICSPQFDGIEVYGDHYANINLLAELEEEINDSTEFLGMNLRLKYKSHDEEILRVPDDFDESNVVVAELPNDFIIPDGTDKVYADIVRSKCKDTFIYQNKTWFELNSVLNIWKVQEHIINTIMNVLIEHVDIYSRYKIASSIENENDQEQINKQLVMMRRYVGSTSGSSNVEKALKKLFTPEKPIEFDSIPHILAFPDGTCYDLNTREFKQIQPTDYVSKTCRVSLSADEYALFKSGDDEIDNKLVSIISDTFTSPQDKTEEEQQNRALYGICRLSRCLYGRNTQETYDEWVGVGGNGKSNLSTLFINSLGDYVETISPEQLTKPQRDATTANSGLVSCIGKRLVICSEPQEYDKIQSAIIKRWTGNDEIKARGLFENERKFVPTFNIVIQSNHVLPYDSTDAGIRRRRRIIKFEKSYVSQTEYNKWTDETRPKCVRLGDSSLKQLFKTEEYAKRFIALLITHYHVPESDYSIPHEFVDEVNDALDDSNPISWFKEYCDISDKQASIETKDLHQIYSEYCVLKNVKALNPVHFSRNLKRLFPHEIECKRTKTSRYFQGLSIKPYTSDNSI